MKTRVCLPQNSRQWSAARSSCWQSQKLQFTQMLGLPHTMVSFSVFCCPGSMPLNLLMPKTTNPFDAGCWPNMLLSWTWWFMCHITFPVEQQKVFHGTFLAALLQVCLWRLSWQNKGKKLPSLVPCSMASLRHLVNIFICTVVFIVIWLLSLDFFFGGVHSLPLFCQVKLHTTAKLALTKWKGKSSDKIRRYCGVTVWLFMSWITAI